MHIADIKLEQLNCEEVKIGLKATSPIKPTYGAMNLPCLQLPWVTLSTFGVPPKGQYTKEDKQRMFIKVPIEEKSDLYAQLSALDAKMKYHIIMTSNLDIFGSGNMYEYEPLLKYSEKHGKAYIKLKLDTSYPEDEILTEVWFAGNGPKHQCQFDNIDDFALCVPFKSDIRMIVKVVKLWVINKRYGLTIKVKKIEVKPLETKAYQI